MSTDPGQPGKSSGEVSFFAGEPTRDGRRRSGQLRRRLDGDQAPKQIAASCRQMIDVYVIAAGAKLSSSASRRGKAF